MVFQSYTKTDDYYEFVASDGLKLLVPVSSIILVDDESGALAIKTIGSRSTIGIVPKPLI